MFKRILLGLIIFTSLLGSNSFAVDSDGVAELEAAKMQAKKRKCPIFIQVGTSWCGWCPRLSSFLAKNKVVNKSLNENYVYLKLEHNEQSKVGVLKPFTPITSFPYILIVDCNGKLIHRNGTGWLEDLRKSDYYSEKRVLAVINTWKDGDPNFKRSKNHVKISTEPSETVVKPTAGLSLNHYTGRWKKLPVFNSLIPNKVSIAQKIDGSSTSKEEFVGLQFTGYFYIETAGKYNIKMGSNDGSKLAIGGKTVINNDGLHHIAYKYAQVELKKGYYPLEATYFRNGGNYGLEFSMFLASDSSVIPKLIHSAK